MKPAAQSVDEIEFPAASTPVAMFFAIVAPLTALSVVMTLVTTPLPPYLVILLAVVAGSCVMLAKLAIEGLGAVSIELGPQALVVKRMLGNTSYPWADIESFKVYNPGATFANSGRGEDVHVGLGLFIRQADRKKERDEEAGPDVLLVTVASEEVDKLTKACSRLEVARRKAASGSDPRRSGIGGKTGKSFRRPAAA